MKIGVFDSGVGGLSVVKAIEKALPNAEPVAAHGLSSAVQPSLFIFCNKKF